MVRQGEDSWPDRTGLAKARHGEVRRDVDDLHEFVRGEGNGRIATCSALAGLRELPNKFFHCAVTSPPYYGLRAYDTEPSVWGGSAQCEHEWGGMLPVAYRAGEDSDGPVDNFNDRKKLRQSITDSGSYCSKCAAWRGHLGLEPTPEMFVMHLTEIFRELRRVLRSDGTFWVNIGDCYAKTTKGSGTPSDKNGRGEGYIGAGVPQGCKVKDLIGIPWMLAFAMRADGWYLRQEIQWCLSGGTWVYARTQKGDGPAMLGDLTVLDPATVKLWNGTKWTQVTRWTQSTAKKKKIKIVLRSGERIECTGDHLWPTRRGNVRADSLEVGDIIETCTIPEPDGAYLPAYLDLETMWFIGLYLAEGSRADDTIQLGLNVDELPWISRLQAVAKRYGGSLTYTVDKSTLSVRMYGKVLNAILAQFIIGRRSSDVRLRSPAWKLPNDALRMIAAGYLDGDGHKEGKRIRLGFCRNYYLERDLRVLAARLGASLRLKPCVATGFSRKFPAFRGEWRWERSGHAAKKQNGEIIELRNGSARQYWDVSVADEPHLFSLASGVLTHNCKTNPLPESTKDRPACATEKIFLFTRSKHYYYDLEAERVPSTKRSAGNNFHRPERLSFTTDAGDSREDARAWEASEDRNLWNYWLIGSEGFKGAHFAVFPSEIPRRCISLGSSLKGCCPNCSAPWRRIVERTRKATRPARETKLEGHDDAEVGHRDKQRHVTTRTTLGWEPTCECKEECCTKCGVVLAYSDNKGVFYDDTQETSESHTNAHLRMVQSKVQEPGELSRTEESVLFKEVQGYLDGEKPSNNNREACDNEGVRADSPSGTSRSIEVRVRDGAQTGDGEVSKEEAPEKRGSPPHKRKKKRQSTSKPGTDAQKEARQISETSPDGKPALPSLPRPRALLDSCPHCGSTELVVRALDPDASRVIDPFSGSGTTVLTALRMGRRALGLELSEKYAGISRTRIAESIGLFA